MTIDIDQELQNIVANEELLAFFDFRVAADGHTVDGLCKVSRPRERRSKATYVSIFFVIDLPDDATYRAIEAHMRKVDWAACGEATLGVDCMVAIPHRGGDGLLLKEVDAYLDGSRTPDAAFVRDILQPALVRAAGLHPGELTVWNDSAPASARGANNAGSVLARLRRLTER